MSGRFEVLLTAEGGVGVTYGTEGQQSRAEQGEWLVNRDGKSEVCISVGR